MTMPTKGLLKTIPAVFYRGGTSKGLFFQARDLAAYTQDVRTRVLLSAMGSPDPDGRQIDGLGGGVSSLSKVAIVSGRGEGWDDRMAGPEYAWPGVDWKHAQEEAEVEGKEWDVNYLFGQVGVRESTIDWASTCGNLMAAVAQYAIDERLLSPRRIAYLERRWLSSPASSTGASSSLPFRVPVRILAANTGARITAHVELAREAADTGGFQAAKSGGAAIAGVPGTASPIVIESPLKRDHLVTGRERDVFEVDCKKLECTIIDAGLPTILLPLSSLAQLLPSSFAENASHFFSLSPADLDAHPSFLSAVERVRHSAWHALRDDPDAAARSFSATAPKVAIVGPSTPYKSSGGRTVDGEEQDVTVRAVSVGNVHRTIMATALSAMAVAAAYPRSVVAEAVGGRKVRDDEDAAMIRLRVGQPAGVSEASVALDGAGQPRSIVVVRTARRLMQGQVLVPDSAFGGDTMGGPL